MQLLLFGVPLLALYVFLETKEELCRKTQIEKACEKWRGFADGL